MQQIQIHPPSSPGGPVVATAVPSGVPQTNAEYRALRAKREELSNQLISATGRRNDLAEQLKTADPAARAGIQDRLRVLDERIVKLEGEIERTGVLIADAPPHVMSSTTIDPAQLAERVVDDIIPLVSILAVFVILPFTFAISRFIWKRAGTSNRPVVADHASQQRLEQMQQSIDAIAIEVERISEGQRYVTRILSERGIGAGAAEPAAISRRASVPSERG